jgi:hypothetical protein
MPLDLCGMPGVEGHRVARSEDRQYVRSAGRGAAREGSAMIEPSKLSLADLRAAITALGRRPCGKLKDNSSSPRPVRALLAPAQGEARAKEKGVRRRCAQPAPDAGPERRADLAAARVRGLDRGRAAMVGP